MGGLSRGGFKFGGIESSRSQRPAQSRVLTPEEISSLLDGV